MFIQINYYFNEKYLDSSSVLSLYFSNNGLIAKVDIDTINFDLKQSNVYEYQNIPDVEFFWNSNIIFENPQSSANWRNDPSWYLKVVGGVRFNYSDIGELDAVLMNKLSLNISGSGWNPLIDANIITPGASDSLILVADNLTGKYLVIVFNLKIYVYKYLIILV